MLVPLLGFGCGTPRCKPAALLTGVGVRLAVSSTVTFCRFGLFAIYSYRIPARHPMRAVPLLAPVATRIWLVPLLPSWNVCDVP